jgi:hypothetical protein
VPITENDVPPFPTDRMGDMELSDLGLPDLSDDEIEDVLKGMSSRAWSPSPTPTLCTVCSPRTPQATSSTGKLWQRSAISPSPPWSWPNWTP